MAIFPSSQKTVCVGDKLLPASAAARVKIFIVLPGSKRSLMARLRRFSTSLVP
jgi:hypothetical protein